MNHRNSRLHVAAIAANICARLCVDAMSQRCSKDGEWWSGGDRRANGCSANGKIPAIRTGKRTNSDW